MSDRNEPLDPRHQGEQPPHAAQEQPPTGREGAMEPAPDYGRHTYRGFGRLKGRTALITGGG